MSIQRMLNSKKAISPILATLLLIVIAVAAIVVTYAWITTYIGNTTQQAGVLLYTENVKWGTGYTEITVGNSGTGDTRLIRVYIGNSATNLTDITSEVTFDPSSKALNAGSVSTMNYTWASDSFYPGWTAGDNYYFRIVPNPGQFLEFSDRAPQ